MCVLREKLKVFQKTNCSQFKCDFPEGKLITKPTDRLNTTQNEKDSNYNKKIRTFTRFEKAGIKSID